MGAPGGHRAALTAPDLAMLRDLLRSGAKVADSMTEVLAPHVRQVRVPHGRPLGLYRSAIVTRPEVVVLAQLARAQSRLVNTVLKSLERFERGQHIKRWPKPRRSGAAR